MSEIRKPTARLGRVKKDPRIDSVPPPTPRRSVPPPSTRSRLSEGMLPRVEGRKGAFGDEAKTNPMNRLEELLAREKAILEGQLANPGTSPRRKHDSVPTLATARAIASELARVLERIRDKNSLSDLPAPKSSSRS